MDKQQAIQFLENNHKKMIEVVNSLSNDQMIEKIVNLTPKDILAHISAWNLELTRAIDELLENKKPWFVNEEELTESEFNNIEIEKRSSWSLDQVLEEWHNTFENLINRMKQLTNFDWDYKTNFEWGKNKPVTVNSLFSYTYKGEGHEGGHAKQIEEYFKNN